MCTFPARVHVNSSERVVDISQGVKQILDSRNDSELYFCVNVFPSQGLISPNIHRHSACIDVEGYTNC